MLDIRFNSIHAKAACFLLLICFVVGGAAVFTTRKVEAIRSTAFNSANKFPTDLPTNAKANGKTVTARASTSGLWMVMEAICPS